MSPYALAISILLFSLASCIFAFVKGGAQERIAAAIILANLLATAANETFLHQNQIVLLTIDGLTAVGLLPLTLRYASFWLGAVMLMYGLQFGLHAFYFVLEREKDMLHVTINNTNFFAISLALAVGTTIAWRKRLRTRKARAASSAAAAPPPATPETAA